MQRFALARISRRLGLRHLPLLRRPGRALEADPHADGLGEGEAHGVPLPLPFPTRKRLRLSPTLVRRGARVTALGGAAAAPSWVDTVSAPAAPPGRVPVKRTSIPHDPPTTTVLPVQRSAATS